MNASNQKGATTSHRVLNKIKPGLRHDVAILNGLTDAEFKNGGVNQAASTKHRC